MNKKITNVYFYTLVANKLAVGVGLEPTEIVLRTAILSLFVFHHNVDKNLIAVIFLSQTHSNHKNWWLWKNLHLHPYPYERYVPLLELHNHWERALDLNQKY